MGLLTAPTVKRFEFHKSKMAHIGPPYSGKTIKISNFWKLKMAAAAISKITKSRYLRNGLTDIYEIWYTDASTVKKIRISQIQDGGRPPF